MMSTFLGGGVYESNRGTCYDATCQPTLACLLSECFQDNPLVNPLGSRFGFWQQRAHLLYAHA